MVHDWEGSQIERGGKEKRKWQAIAKGAGRESESEKNLWNEQESIQSDQEGGNESELSIESKGTRPRDR